MCVQRILRSNALIQTLTLPTGLPLWPILGSLSTVEAPLCHNQSHHKGHQNLSPTHRKQGAIVSHRHSAKTFAGYMDAGVCRGSLITHHHHTHHSMAK